MIYRASSVGLELGSGLVKIGTAKYHRLLASTVTLTWDTPKSWCAVHNTGTRGKKGNLIRGSK